jgi:hypothetical protein
MTMPAITTMAALAKLDIPVPGSVILDIDTIIRRNDGIME